MSDERAQEEYDLYYDECERANKRPLSYEEWRKREGLDT